jgi:hypothetical protein
MSYDIWYFRKFHQATGLVWPDIINYESIVLRLSLILLHLARRLLRAGTCRREVRWIRAQTDSVHGLHLLSGKQGRRFGYALFMLQVDFTIKNRVSMIDSSGPTFRPTMFRTCSLSKTREQNLSAPAYLNFCSATDVLPIARASPPG